ncbi:MAG TPA: hypothetical protein VFW33_04800, partial [Gemmataceae bacterium]|nr:hypothetical protein [Gemmataceae bacterium]
QDLLIETYPGIPADKKAAYEKVKDDKEKRKHFFAEWGRERFKEAEVNGVYILITKDPGFLQIEVGNVTAGHAFTMENRDHLEALMLKEFKAKEYDKGLLDGVNYVKTAMGDNLKRAKADRAEPAAPPPTDYPSGPRESRPTHLFGGGWLGLLCVGLAVVAGIWVLFAVIRALSGARRGYGPGGYGGPAYGGPAYGGGYGYGPGGGGGFLSGMLGGLFGGAAGGWLYDRFFHGGGTPAGGYGGGYGGTATPGPEAPQDQPQDTDATGVGGSFDNGDGGDAGGGDFGGDTGGGDVGGGDFGGGGDVGGGDTGGGDF